MPSPSDDRRTSEKRPAASERRSPGLDVSFVLSWSRGDRDADGVPAAMAARGPEGVSDVTWLDVLRRVLRMRVFAGFNTRLLIIIAALCGMIVGVVIARGLGL